jgi:hypothetical protein
MFHPTCRTLSQSNFRRVIPTGRAHTGVFPRLITTSRCRSGVRKASRTPSFTECGFLTAAVRAYFFCFQLFVSIPCVAFLTEPPRTHGAQTPFRLALLAFILMGHSFLFPIPELDFPARPTPYSAPGSANPLAHSFSRRYNTLALRHANPV